MNILIVEDDKGVAFLIQEAIEDAGRSIAIANSGAEAIEYICLQQPDLLILDYSLSDMNARELIDKLSGRQVKMPYFVISTGQGDEVIAVEMMKMGAHDYLVKDASLMKRIPGVVNRAIHDIKKERELEDAIQAKRESDDKLKEEQRRLANIIKATRVGTWEWNIAADEVILNERYAQILGHSLEELQPLTSGAWKILINLAENEEALQLLDDHFNGRSGYFEVETKILHKSGRCVWLLNRGCIIEYDMDGKPLLMSGTMQDITDKKLREDLEKEVEVARKNLQFKQNFLASMSHEMRTPLTGICGIADLLLKTNLDETQRDFVSILGNASEQLKEIIDQVLDYSDIEQGRMTLVPGVFYVEALVDQARKLFNKICTKPIAFEVFVDPAMPSILKADHKRIMQVVNTLISNAIKYSEKGVLSLAFLLQEKIDEKYVMVEVGVSDSGIGISNESRSTIFTPFKQVDKINTSYYEGTGLGLAICKEIVDLHGGRIDFQNNDHGGTRFWFTFKAELVEKEEWDEDKEDPSYDFSSLKLRILFVEDKAITQKVVTLQLNDLGHEVEVASNGKEAIQKYIPGKFDLILMDIQMPVMDGITATRELKSRFTDLPPVVGLSANAFDGAREEYMKQGFDEYMTKPMNNKRFMEILKVFFGKQTVGL
jgi:PAS domain S-box-containing protein